MFKNLKQDPREIRYATKKSIERFALKLRTVGIKYPVLILTTYNVYIVHE